MTCGQSPASSFRRQTDALPGGAGRAGVPEIEDSNGNIHRRKPGQWTRASILLTLALRTTPTRTAARPPSTTTGRCPGDHYKPVPIRLDSVTHGLAALDRPYAAASKSPRHLIEVEERAVGRVVGGNDRVKSGSRSLDLSSRVNAALSFSCDSTRRKRL